MAWSAVDAIRRPQKMSLEVVSPPIKLVLPPRKDRTVNSINTSTNATTVTLNLYANMNCLSGRPCQIFVPIMGTRIPSGKMIVGLSNAVVCFDNPNSTALRNFTLSERAHGSLYVNRMRMSDCTAGSLTTLHSRLYVSIIPISYASISCSSSSSSSSSSSTPFFGIRVSISVFDLSPPPPHPMVQQSPPSILISTSFLNNPTNTVITNMKLPINLTNPPRLTNPVPGRLGNRNNGLHKFSLLSTSFSAKNPT
mmetsp:Transcript_25948/g.44042  ORF Transcript_25948/g.44042 Transcript_25948/m.44042 type:complete len:252 (-) Transcript_25948:1055-1810(-)